MPPSFTSSKAHRRKSSMASTALNPTLKGKKKRHQPAESETAAAGPSLAKVMLARVYEDASCIVHQLLKSQYKNTGDGELILEDNDDDEEEEEGDSGEDDNDDDIFHPPNDNEQDKKRKMSTRTPPILTFLPSTTETTSQPDEQSWVKAMRKPRTTTLVPPPAAATALATTSSVLSSCSYPPTRHSTPPPQPFLPSRQLTKSQLTSMVWHVRELSRRLGFIRIKMHVHSIFLLTKIHDSTLTERTRELVSWLLSPERGARYVIYVESALLRSHRFDIKGLRTELATRHRDAGDENAAVEIEDPEHGRIRVWTTELCHEKAETFDFCITLGGDGTVLYAGWLFQQVVPPVLTFSLGSLGFLTKYNFDHYQETLTGAFQEGVVVSLRLRFECTVMRSNARPRVETKTKSPEGNTEISVSPTLSSTEHSTNQQEDRTHNKNNDDGNKKKGDDDSELPSPTPPPLQNDLIDELIGSLRHSPTHTPTSTFSILNELVLDRGPSASLTTLEIFGDTRHFTTVLADGLVISTPTGSTAYNLAAGGSLCHPENPVMLVTAICAHALSFRPIILPDTIVLRVGVPYDARTGSWAAFDGRERVELGPGDYVTVSASRYPFASVVGEGGSGAGDWVNSIRQKLGWNTRQKQKAFVD